jgi:hypothetical protein
MNPPTEGTWWHEVEYEKEDAAGKIIKSTYRHVSSASHKKCVLCGYAQPRNPKKLWPDYVRACKIVGIDPGMIWQQREDGTPIMRSKGGSWRNAPELP